MRKYKFHSKEEKLAIVKRYIAGESSVKMGRDLGISDRLIRTWRQKYLEQGEVGLEPTRKPGNPFVKYTNRKDLTHEEKLEYEIALLKHELLKKDGEITRLKKSIELERGDAKKR